MEITDTHHWRAPGEGTQARVMGFGKRGSGGTIAAVKSGTMGRSANGDSAGRMRDKE